MGKSLEDYRRTFWGRTDEEYATLKAAVDDGVTAERLFASAQNDRVWLNAGRFQGSAGAPALSSNTLGGRFQAFAMDAAADEQINATFVVPSFWQTMDIDLYWSNLGVGAGNVRWNITYSNRATGEDLALGDVSIGAQDIAAPAQNILKITPFGLNIAVPDELWHCRVVRDADNAGDTLANDAAFVGLLLKRVT